MSKRQNEEHEQNVNPIDIKNSRAPGVHHSDPACGAVLHPGGAESNRSYYGPIMTDVESPRTRSHSGAEQLTPPYRRKSR